MTEYDKCSLEGAKSVLPENKKGLKYEREYVDNSPATCRANSVETLSAKVNVTPITEIVEISGVKWATCNLGANQPYEYGKYYTWEEAKRVCPAGWRLPTRDEIHTLWRVPNKWTTMGSVKGMEFGTPPNTIFMPAAGCRYKLFGMFGSVGLYGRYWTSTLLGDKWAYKFHTGRNCNVEKGYMSTSTIHKYAASVRLVEE